MSSKSPEIRFNGYTDDWEQRKLEDISTYIRGSFPQPYTNPKFYDEKDGKPFVQVADIGFDLKLNADTKAHISKLAEPKSRFVKAGKVIVALQGSIEKSIGRTAITQYDAYFDRTILIFEDYKIPVDKQYFAQVIKALFEREKERAWGATISTITKKHLNNFIIGVPSIEEQKQIGMFFKQLDNNIALHQRELDNLLKSKKGFLQKMFPKQGGKVPEVRFSKFAKDWKQHDLKDIYKKSNEKNKNLKYGKEYIISVAKMQYKENDSVSSEDYMKTYNVMKKNDIAFEGNKSKKYKYGRFVLNDIGDGIVSHVFIVMRPKMEMSASFLKEYINNESVMQQILLFSTTSTLMMTTLNTKEFLEQKLRLPSLEEQLEIGSFFEELDSSIFLKQKQLNNLKQTKKAFLQKMFV